MKSGSETVTAAHCAMIVEDDVQAREAIAAHLRDRGWKVIECNSYEEAGEYIKQARRARRLMPGIPAFGTMQRANPSVAMPDVLLADYEIFSGGENGEAEVTCQSAKEFMQRRGALDIPVIAISREESFNQKLLDLGRNAAVCAITKGKLTRAIANADTAVLEHFDAMLSACIPSHGAMR